MKARQITNIVIPFLVISFGLSACNDNKSQGPQQISLSEGESVLMNKGDKVIPRDETTQIKISHIVETDERYVTLIAGNAIVQRKEK